jgi:hypothetical protein
MGSLTRSDLVLTALKQAGRGAELKAHAEILLNQQLRTLANTNKYPKLRKVGAVSTLSAGSSTLPLPADFGAGVDRLLTGIQRIAIEEKTLDEFVDMGGFPETTASAGRPSYYFLDREAGVFRFNVSADQAYDILPIYFKTPADIAIGAPGDLEYPWFEDDKILTELLIAQVYQYTEDQREFEQDKKAQYLLAQYRQNAMQIEGGSARVRLSPSRFRRP